MTKTPATSAKKTDALPQPKHYRKAARRLAFGQASVVASIVTTFTALGFLLAKNPYPLFVWGLEFVVALIISYWHSLRRIKTEAAELFEE